MAERLRIEQVIDTDLCAGCGLCAGVFAPKVEMKLDPPGYLRPHARMVLTEQEEELLADICPGVHLDLDAGGIDNHPIWGPIVKARVGFATDKALRHAGSSGGVLSALQAYLIETGKVGYALHTTMPADNPIGTETVESQSKDDIKRGAGSRYAPSAPLANLLAHLERDEPFVLVGKPCDIAGARALARHDERVRRTMPYLLSFFCAGVPSSEGTREILRQMGVKEEDLMSFRYRGDGWPGYAKAQTRDGRVEHMSYAESWGGILSKHVQFRCKVCPDGTGGFADVACGDAWHCDEKGYPLFEEQEGLSLIVSRSWRGEELVKAAIESGYIKAEDFDENEIAQMQPGQHKRKRLVQSRLLALRLTGRLTPRFRGLELARAADTASRWERLRSLAGSVRRLIM
jgi:coenzyme F420 hydrogenase subunit beta